MKYLLVECATKDLLEERVTDLLRIGYECQGGVSVSQCYIDKGGKDEENFFFSPHVKTIYAQAMWTREFVDVKREIDAMLRAGGDA